MTRENKDASSAILKAFESGGIDRLAMRLDNYQNPDNGFGGSNDPTNKMVFDPRGFNNKAGFENLYVFNWLAARIINTIPEDAFREWIDFKSPNADFIKTMNEVLEEFDVRAKCQETSVNGRLYGGALMIIGADDGQDIAEPLDEDNIKEIKYLTVLDRYQVVIDKVFNDPLKANFGEPAVYSLQPFNTLSAQGIDPIVSTENMKVHSSRTARIDGEFLPSLLKAKNQGWGGSTLLALQRDLQHYGTSIQSVAVLLQDYITKVLQVENLAELLQNKDSSALDARLKFALSNQSSIGMTLIGKDEELKKIQTPTTGLKDLVEIMTQNVSASAKIPRTRLFGQQLGKLAGATETTVEYDDTVKGYQVEKVRTPLNYLLTILSKDKSRFPVQEDDWQWSFNPLRQDTNKQKAENNKNQADADAVYIDRGVLTPEEVAKNRFSPDGGSLDTVVDLDEREEFDELDAKLTDFTKIETEEEAKSEKTTLVPVDKKDDISLIINITENELSVEEEVEEEIRDCHVHEVPGNFISCPLFLENGDHYHEVHREGRIPVRTSEGLEVEGGHIHEMPDGTKTGLQLEDRDQLTRDRLDAGEEVVTLQSIIISKKIAPTVKEARDQAKKFGNVSKVDETASSFHFRQKEPGEFQFNSSRSLKVEGTPGIILSLGKLK